MTAVPWELLAYGWAAVALLMPGLISDLGGLAAFVLLAITNRKNGGRVGESEIGETVV